MLSGLIGGGVMNNKEFIAELSRRMGYTMKDTSSLMSALVTEMTAQLEEENVVSVQNFGSFEVKKKQERVVVNPATQQRMLVPPKLIISFKPTASFKEKMQ